MIIITGKPRSGTSMMTRCIHLAGVPLAFTPSQRGEKQEQAFRNIYGFYEGAWNKEDGVLKSFCPTMFKQFINPRFIYMERSEDKMEKSWVAINPQVTLEQRRELKEKANRTRTERIEKGFPTVPKCIDEVKNYPHIIVNYDKFVTEPEHYRFDFELLFPELDYNVIIRGIDNNLYINR